MITALDSSVILDVLCNDPVHAEKSVVLMQRARLEGRIIVCECVLAEISPVLSDKDMREFVADWQIQFVPSTLESALLAGRNFRIYLNRGGKSGRVLPDFIIGAHAQLQADRLLARDRGYFRDYFKSLKMM
jgi:hypothetical protein